MALAHTLLRHGRRVSDARTALESAEIVASSWHEGIPQLAYYKALVARDAGDFRGALREFRVTDQVSRRLGLDGFRRRAEQPAANLMQVLGDNESALAKLREIERELPAGVPACERAEAMTNRGWAELVALRSPSAPSPMAPVDRLAKRALSRRSGRGAQRGNPPRSTKRRSRALELREHADVLGGVLSQARLHRHRAREPGACCSRGRRSSPRRNHGAGDPCRPPAAELCGALAARCRGTRRACAPRCASCAQPIQGADDARGSRLHARAPLARDRRHGHRARGLG